MLLLLISEILLALQNVDKSYEKLVITFNASKTVGVHWCLAIIIDTFAGTTFMIAKKKSNDAKNKKFFKNCKLFYFYYLQ